MATPCNAMPCHAMPWTWPCHSYAMLATRTGAASTSTLVWHKLHGVQCTSYASAQCTACMLYAAGYTLHACMQPAAYNMQHGCMHAGGPDLRCEHQRGCAALRPLLCHLPPPQTSRPDRSLTTRPKSEPPTADSRAAAHRTAAVRAHSLRRAGARRRANRMARSSVRHEPSSAAEREGVPVCRRGCGHLDRCAVQRRAARREQPERLEVPACAAPPGLTAGTVARGTGITPATSAPGLGAVDGRSAQ
jgi:hypothetical protein